MHSEPKKVTELSEVLKMENLWHQFHDNNQQIQIYQNKFIVSRRGE